VAEIETAPGRTLAFAETPIARKAVPELRRCLLADASQRAAE
jgi:hypothetical protein